MSRSIGVRILLTTSLIVTIISGAFIVYFEGHARTIAIQRLTSSLTETAKVTAGSISNWIRIRSNLTEVLAKNMELLEDIETPEPVIQFMRHKTYTDTFLTCFLGAETGTTHTYPRINLPATYDPRRRPWYIDIKAYGKTMITEPYVDAFTGKMIMSTVTPIYQHNNFIGAAGGDIVLTDIIKLVQKIDLGNLGYAFLVNEQGTVLIHPDPNQTLLPLTKVFPNELPNLKQTELDFSGQGPEVFAFFPVPNLPGASWKLGIAINRDKAFETITDFRNSALITAALTILTIISLMGLSIRKRIIHPLNQMTGAMTRLSKGDLNVDIPEAKNDDEIGAMNQAMQIFKENALEMRAMREEKLRSEILAEAEKQAAMEQAASKFEESIIKVVQLLSASASSLNSAAVDMSVIADGSADLAAAGAQASAEASDYVASIATATGQLSSSISEINHQTEQAVNLATETLLVLESCDAITDEQLQQLQTIKSHVTNLRELNVMLTSAVTEQSTATEEISRNVQQAATKADEVAQTLIGAKQIAKETDSSALNISSAAADLAMQTDTLHIEADNFLRHIRKN